MGGERGKRERGEREREERERGEREKKEREERERKERGEREEREREREIPPPIFFQPLLLPPLPHTHRYFPPTSPGYSTEMMESSVRSYEYPSGSAWAGLIARGGYRDPSREKKKLPY